MKTDDEVRLLLRERKKGVPQEVAAARAGMSVRTARKYENLGQLPSETTSPRTYRTRTDPFAEDWPWIQEQLEADSALQAKTLFAILMENHPDRYTDGQLRTLQRRIEAWRALQGPHRTVMFEQVHQPGNMAQSDFTRMEALGVTIAGEPFPHLFFHLVLTYSNHEEVYLCPSESFEALAEGIEHCLWRLGGVPAIHRTDNLSAAIRKLDATGRKDFTARYEALMAHYGMRPTHNKAGEAHQNGDVEQSHFRFKDALDQALRVRGHRDFPSVDAYLRFVGELLRRRNQTRIDRFAEDRAALRPLPKQALDPARIVRCRVSRFSTVHLLENTYSVPSRLIGCDLKARVRANTLDLYLGHSHILTLPRLVGRKKHRIDYRHVIWSLVRKPGAFAAYRFRDELFPSLAFRKAYDHLAASRSARADAEYLRILHLAASTSEQDVETAIGVLLDEGSALSFDAVRDLVSLPKERIVPVVQSPSIDLAEYDSLISGMVRHG